MALAPRPGKNPGGPLFSRRSNDLVDWLTCEPAVFRRALEEDKPVFMLLGSAFAHTQDATITDKESDAVFRDRELSQRLNSEYVSVLVDTDEQPEWERLLSAALSALRAATRRPMLGIFTPQGELFFATGPLPSQAPEGQPSLRNLLDQTLLLKQNQPEEFAAQAQRLTEQLRSRAHSPTGASESAMTLGSDVLRHTRMALQRAFDDSFFGFGQGSKPAHAPVLEFLLERAARHKDVEAERMALLSLAATSGGGMYDQLWGGFFEATTDRAFQQPVFHKRLGQNAELARLYLRAFQLSHHEPLRRVATETLTFLIQHFKAPEGGFFFGSYAETPQGEHYLWSRRQLKKALGEPAATHFAHFYGIDGVTDGAGHLQARKSLSRVASDLGIPEAELVTSLHASRLQLQELRQRRAGLILDDRLVTADNAATISALSVCSLVLDSPDYLGPAEQAAQRFWSARFANGLLPRTLGHRLPGRLKDHVLFLRALIDLHQTSLKPEYLSWAQQLQQVIDERFLSHLEASSEQFVCAFALHSNESRWPTALKPLLGLDEDATFGHPAGLLSLELRRLAVLLRWDALGRLARTVATSQAGVLRRAPHTACALVRAVDQLLEPALLLQLPSAPAQRSAVHRVAASQLSPLAMFTTNDTPDRALQPPTETTFFANPTTPDEVKEQWASYQKGIAEARRSQLFADQVPGSADEAATREAVTRIVAPHVAHFRELSLCRLGLGSYRVGLDDPAHAAALKLALEQGINVIDTSPSFAFGNAQRLIGETLRRMIAAGQVRREGLFFVNKLGLAVAEDAEQLEARRLSTAPPLATVTLDRPKADEGAKESLKHGAFSLDPDFLSWQISTSLERLGLARLELCLINSPEHLLAAGYNQARLKTALQAAFARLDQEAERGRILGYGLMSNTLVTRGAPEHDPLTSLTLEDVLDWASEQNPNHRLYAIEMPANLVESAPYAADDHAVFRRAKHHGLLTIACRPLSAFVDGALLRLVPPPSSPDGARADQLGAAKYKVAALEAEFETTWAVQLRLAGRAGKSAVLPLSGALGSTLEALQTRQQFDHAEATLVTPRLRALLAQLERAFMGQPAFASFKDKYIQAVGGYLACLRETCSEKNRQLLQQLATRYLSTPTLPTHERERFLSQSWPERAVGALLTSDCVDVVLLGMRSEQHVYGVQSLLQSSPGSTDD